MNKKKEQKNMGKNFKLYKSKVLCEWNWTFFNVKRMLRSWSHLQLGPGSRDTSWGRACRCAASRFLQEAPWWSEDRGWAGCSKAVPSPKLKEFINGQTDKKCLDRETDKEIESQESRNLSHNLIYTLCSKTD